MAETTAGTAGSTTEKIERPPFGEIYLDLNAFDDEAVADHLGYDLESLFDGLNDGSLSPGDLNNIVRACEFLRLRKELAAQQVPSPDALAAQMVKEQARRELAPISDAYWAATLAALTPEDNPDPESPEGKASPLDEPSAAPSATSAPASTPPASETND